MLIFRDVITCETSNSKNLTDLKCCKKLNELPNTNCRMIENEDGFKGIILDHDANIKNR